MFCLAAVQPQATGYHPLTDSPACRRCRIWLAAAWPARLCAPTHPDPGRWPWPCLRCWPARRAGAQTSQAINNNPDLRPERSQTRALSAEWTAHAASLRATLFHQHTHGALYAQLNISTNTNTVQNIHHVRTTGPKLAASVAEPWTAARLKGLRLQGSLTYADRRILANSGYLLVPGDTIVKWQPRVMACSAGPGQPEQPAGVGLSLLPAAQRQR